MAVYALSLGRPVVRSDEAWFVWVVQRMKQGDVLYRDVYFVSTPLAAWLGAAVSMVGGITIRTMRVLSAGIFVSSAGLVWWTARRTRLGLVGRLILLAALFAYASPIAHFASIYSALAVLWSLVAFAAAVVWLEEPPESADRRPRALSVAGVAIGLSIGSKPNIGVLTLGALVLTLLICDRSRLHDGAHSIRRVVLSAAAVVGTLLMLIASTGSLGAFAGDVLLEKNDYVRVMNRSLLPGFGNVLDILPGHGTTLCCPRSLAVRYKSVTRSALGISTPSPLSHSLPARSWPGHSGEGADPATLGSSCASRSSSSPGPVPSPSRARNTWPRSRPCCSRR